MAKWRVYGIGVNFVTSDAETLALSIEDGFQYEVIEGGPADEGERLMLYDEMIEAGLSDSEARGTAWPEENGNA